ncbi:aldo/keto reductase [Anaeromyces robustus]|uniref:Aldo/keto reductase n=1 Tax=Anaeromyces robustus TaxID=1754192 RepID=A0A1Y1WXS4_9FUNG|nr:aldo/keto reductase [Anaeromyces robustus]|eukprot:ORX78128.1 aldo/keto reductase [Anaeromyces robustus]
MSYTELNNGVKIPNIGIGTYLIKSEDAERSVKQALQMGYRLVDTAHLYFNEEAVGRAIKESGVKREEIFVSTKLWPCDFENENAVEESLQRLGLDYIDLLFLHQPAGNYMAGYKLLEKAYKEGKIKAIGISNFEGKHIEEILANCEYIPQVNQVECHPYYTQEELRKVTEPKNIKIMSWFPLGQGDAKLINETIFTELAKKYNKTNAQIILKWHIQMGFLVIPGSKNVDHIRDNFNIFDFELTKEDMAKIETVNKHKKYLRGETLIKYFHSPIYYYHNLLLKHNFDFLRKFIS